jgi:hypothetical protein
LFFVAQFWENQPPIHRREHSPEPSACELNLKEIGRIVREHCHAVAARNAEPLAQASGKAADPLIELRIRKAPAGSEVIHSDTVATCRCMMSNPVMRWIAIVASLPTATSWAARPYVVTDRNCSFSFRP